MDDDQFDLFGYPSPPAVGLTPDTLEASTEAADKIQPNADTLRAMVLNYIRWCGEAGATDGEIQAALHMEGNTERPRRWELFNAGLIYSAKHRVNEKGRKCAVWFSYD